MTYSLVCHALLTCLLLALYHKNHAFFDHHLGPWFEGFTFIKDCLRKILAKTAKNCLNEQTVQNAPFARLGE
jgi:hypothetical protein